MLFYLWKRGNSYYYRIRIPSDLSNLFPSPLLRISLKTKNLDAAKISAAHLNKKVQNNFALLRSGAISSEVSNNLIEAIRPKRKQLKMVVVEEKKGHSPTLSELVQAYISDRSPHWTDKTKIEFGCQLKLLVDIMGDKSVTDYTRTDCLACRDMLTRLPTNFSKRKEYRGKPIAEIVALNVDSRLTTKTVNKYLVLLSSLFKWMEKNGYTSGNVATGLVLPIESNPDEERKPYSLEDIQRIKQTLPRDQGHPERYWIPMIAMYQAMRLDEVCQLHIEDIREVEGVICFDINDVGERTVKTKSSRRIVPIHPKLIDLGLLDHIQIRRDLGAVQLWEHIKPDKLGDWGKYFGNWYGRYNRKHVTIDPLKVFHSMRHTVADTLKQAGVAEGVIAEILGHANQSITTGRYGKRYRPGVLMEALIKLDY